MNEGAHFGELALFYKTTRSCTVKAASKSVVCFELSSEIVE